MVKSSVKLFSEEEGQMLREYNAFVEARGRNVRNQWVEFYSVFSLKHKYNNRQISKKMRRLEEKFLKMKMKMRMEMDSSPPHKYDPHLFQLCQSLWGKTLDDDVPQLQPSSSSLKPKPAKSKDEKKKRRNIENVEPFTDGGISSEEDINIDAVDPSIDCDKEKSENKQLMYLPISFGGAEKEKEKDEGDVKTLPNGVVIKDLVVGDRTKRAATKGRMVRVHITGKVKGGDRFFESTDLDKPPLTICLGHEEMIEGFSSDIEGMHVGGKRRLIIPPSMGFGDEGYGKEVPPKSWLEYEVQLLGVRRLQTHPN